jgi:hypothetical protein
MANEEFYITIVVLVLLVVVLYAFWKGKADRFAATGTVGYIIETNGYSDALHVIVSALGRQAKEGKLRTTQDGKKIVDVNSLQYFPNTPSVSANKIRATRSGTAADGRVFNLSGLQSWEGIPYERRMRILQERLGLTVKP